LAALISCDAFLGEDARAAIDAARRRGTAGLTAVDVRRRWAGTRAMGAKRTGADATACMCSTRLTARCVE
jgi:hypothetical protein